MLLLVLSANKRTVVALVRAANQRGRFAADSARPGGGVVSGHQTNSRTSQPALSRVRERDVQRRRGTEVVVVGALGADEGERVARSRCHASLGVSSTEWIDGTRTDGQIAEWPNLEHAQVAATFQPRSPQEMVQARQRGAHPRFHVEPVLSRSDGADPESADGFGCAGQDVVRRRAGVEVSTRAGLRKGRPAQAARAGQA